MANTFFLAHLACPDYSFHFEMSSYFLIIPLLIHLQQQHQYIKKIIPLRRHQAPPFKCSKVVEVFIAETFRLFQLHHNVYFEIRLFLIGMSTFTGE